MKYHKRIYSILFVVVIATFSNCCNKENKLIKQESSNYLSTKSTAVMTLRDSLFLDKMRLYDSVIQYYRNNPNYSSTKTFGLDDGLQETKAYLNVKHVYYDCKYGNVQSYDTSINLPISSGNTVTMNDLYSLYNSSKSKLTNWFNETRFEDKGLVAVSLSKDSLSTTNVVVKLHAVFGNITTKTFDYGSPFGEDDNWRWGGDQGHCNLSNAGEDASDKIEEAINANHIDVVSPAPGYKLVYVPNDNDVVLIGYEYENPNDDPGKDNYLDYLIYYCTAEGSLEIRYDIEECLEYTEMNFYYNGENTLVYEVLISENQELGWFIVGELTPIESGSGNSRKIYHKNKLTFGQYYILLDPDIEFNTDPFSTE